MTKSKLGLAVAAAAVLAFSVAACEQPATTETTTETTVETTEPAPVEPALTTEAPADTSTTTTTTTTPPATTP